MKIQKSLIALFITVLGFNCVSQNETSKWYFGIGAGLDFMTSPPTVLTGGATNVMEGCTSIADGTGNLLFYTDGMTVYNASHVPMANGTGLLGAQTPAQGMVVVKQPGSSTIYYIVTVHGNISPNGKRYSVVDMSLAAGMGSVTVKNATLYPSVCTEYLSAVKHCNGTDVWVVSHDYNNNNFRAHLVTATGISTTAVISSIGSVHGGSISPSCMKFSANGKKLGIALAQNIPNVSHFEVFDFDASTGVLSNSLVLSMNFPTSYGAEFSQDGTKFYGTQGHVTQTNKNFIVQWDLCAGSNSAIVASQFTVATPPFAPGSLQLAKDGKIYVARWSQQSLGVINSPNTAGSGCNYVDNGQSIGTATCQFGLPNFITSFFDNSTPPVYPLFTHSVQCATAQFTAPVLSPACGGTGATSFTWTFGDPASGTANTSTLANPQHVFPGPGTFTVALLIRNGCAVSSMSNNITINSSAPQLAGGGNFNICKGQAFTLGASGAQTYNWTNLGPLQTYTVTPQVTTVYTVTGTSNGCSAVTMATVNVTDCTGLNVEEQMALLFYPNPAADKISVTARNGENVLIYSLSGELIIKTIIEKEKTDIDISGLADGMYFLRTETGVSAFKVIKSSNAN